MDRPRSVNPLIISISVVLLIIVAIFLLLKQCSGTRSSDANSSPTDQGKDIIKTDESDNDTLANNDKGLNKGKAPDALTDQPNHSEQNPNAATTRHKDEPKPAGTPDEETKITATISNFMHAILKLDPKDARQYVDTEKVNYAKLAGLCIIFEEGDYQLSDNRPIRKMFIKDDSAGWVARVESKGSEQNAVFAITTKRKDINSPWKITEINLDKLLTDYAGRFSNGDIHYIPLIKNPKGGDSLAIYFDLDSEKLTTRTKTQLNIVADLLKDDTNKKLTISGHTDALGSDAHNLQLSKQRASQVMTHLIEQGVNESQIKIIGYGKSLPRLPNTTPDGQDAPDGRRANRRAEILLNF